nr:Chain P, GCN4(7P-14P) peptide [synthetic construct]
AHLENEVARLKK